MQKHWIGEIERRADDLREQALLKVRLENYTTWQLIDELAERGAEITYFSLGHGDGTREEVKKRGGNVTIILEV